MRKMVQVLITWDVDPDRWTTLECRKHALSRALDLCREFDIHSTFFFTAQPAGDYSDVIQTMLSMGQEIGCHGLTHTDEEDYDRMPEDLQRAYIQQARQKIEAVTGVPVCGFRSPRVKTSGLTLQLLAEYGYRWDSSVCSQRLDFLSSNLVNPGWLTAPRLPYHPHRQNSFRRGSTPLWEIPVTALVFPLISGSLNVFGLAFMKAFFHLSYLEAERTGKPIVYLAHPTELLPSTRRGKNIHLKQFSLKTIRSNGFLFRNLFFRMDGEQWFAATREFFSFMASYKNLEFHTGSQYVDCLSKCGINESNQIERASS